MMNDLLPAMEAYKIAMSLSPKESQNNVRALAGLGRVYILQNRPLQARPLLEQHSWITQAMGDTRTIAHSNYMMGILLLTEENFPEAQRVFSTARALAATCGDDRLQLNSLNSLGGVARFQGNLPRATELYTQYLNLARSRGVPEMEAIGSLNLALVSLSQEHE